MTIGLVGREGRRASVGAIATAVAVYMVVVVVVSAGRNPVVMRLSPSLPLHQSHSNKTAENLFAATF